MKKQTFLIFILLNLIILKNFAQLDVNHFNLNLENPAFVGSKNKLSVGLDYRKNFVDLFFVGFNSIDGAPTVFMANVYTPISSKIGIGVSLTKDKIGPVEENIFAVDVSYRLNIISKSVLSFGIKSGYRVFDGNFEQLLAPDGTIGPHILINNEGKENNFNLGFGAYFNFKEIENHNFSLGLSMPNFLKEEAFGNDVPTNIIQTLSYETSITEKIKLNIFEKLTLPSEGDTKYYLSANIEFKNIIGVGFNIQKNFYGVQLNSPKIANIFRVGFVVGFVDTQIDDFDNSIEFFSNLDFNNLFNQ